MPISLEPVSIALLPDGRMRVRGIGPRYTKTGEVLVFYYKDELDHWLQQSGLVTSTAEARRRQDAVSAAETQREAGDA
jgi:hypothetical protein